MQIGFHSFKQRQCGSCARLGFNEVTLAAQRSAARQYSLCVYFSRLNKHCSPAKINKPMLICLFSRVVPPINTLASIIRCKNGNRGLRWSAAIDSEVCLRIKFAQLIWRRITFFPRDTVGFAFLNDRRCQFRQLSSKKSFNRQKVEIGRV